MSENIVLICFQTQLPYLSIPVPDDISPLSDPDPPPGTPRFASRKRYQISLQGKVLHDSFPGRKGGPGLNAYVGSVGFRLVPEADVAETGIRNGDRSVSPLGGKRDLAGCMLQNHRVMIKKVVVQTDTAVIGQAVDLLLRRHSPGISKKDAVRLRFFVKLQILV